MASSFELWQDVGGSQNSRQIGYLVTEATDDNDALDHLELNTPLFYDNMPREDIRIREISKKAGLYRAAAIYTRAPVAKVANDTNEVPQDVTGPNAGTSEDPDKELFSFEFSVEDRLETHPQNIQPIGSGGQLVDSDVGVSPAGPNYELIPFPGWNYDIDYGFRGYNLPRPTGSFTLDIYPEDSKVTRTYQNTVEDLVGTVNDATFRKRAAGECMLWAARGESRNGADWRFSFTFNVRKNLTNVDLGNGVIFASVEGWDLIDPYYEFKTVDLAGGKKATLRECRQAIIWRPFERTDFSALFI